MLRRFQSSDPANPSPPLVLHPRLAPAGKLRVWAGAFGRNRAPANLQWKLDGAQVTPAPLHGHPGLRPSHPHGARSFTGVYELDDDAGVVPGRLHHLRLAAGGDSANLFLQSVPAEIPRDDELRVMLVSCFHQAEDRQGEAGRVVSQIPETRRPHLTLLMGDQVYLDLPTLANFPDDEAKLARRFEESYRLNWAQRDGYSRVLEAAPSVSAPDDHEYWNNYPHPSPVIQNSWKEGGRRQWEAAANALYGSFQLAHPAGLGDELVIDVDPLSILMLDQRSRRRQDGSATLAPGVLDRVEDWVDRLLADELYGAVVTGQSLLDEPVSDFTGNVADFMLANYGDYPALLRQLDRLAAAGRPVLLLTGDVHWGRVTEIRKGGRVRFYEVISSPSSLVTTVGSDQLGGIGEGLGRLFGREPDPWWRHSDPADPPDVLARHILGPGYWTRALHRQKGDQVAVLGLRRRAAGLEMTVTYHPIERHSTPERVGPLRLPSH